MKILQNLSEREKRLLSILAAALIIVAVYFLFSWLIQLGEIRKNEVVEMRKNLQRLNNISATLRSLPTDRALPNGSQLQGAITKLAAERNLEIKKISNIPDNSSKKFERVKVYVRFYHVNMNRIMQLLYDVEYGDRINARISMLKIRPARLTSESLHDVEMHFLVQKPRSKKRRRR